MTDFTIAIPTYNGAKRLPPLLERLRSQLQPESATWEIVVVDNNSTDETAQVVQTYQAQWSASFPLRYCFEPKQGLSFARQRAIQEAKGIWVGFLDDDNLPAQDWVVQAIVFGRANPQVGAFGGQIHGDFAVQPPANFSRIQSLLAIRERGEKPNRYQPELLSLPPGAALVVRRQAWCDCVPQHTALVGRVNGSMLAGEDYEVLLYLYKAGWEIWYCPTLHTYHQIPSHRLEKSYLLSLARGAGLSIFYLRLINVSRGQVPLLTVRMLLGNLGRILRHLSQYGTLVRTDLVAACELELMLGSLLSPFYYLFQHLSVLQRHEGLADK